MVFGGKKKKQKEFEKIYDDNVEQIFRFVYLKTSSKDDAEDITSKVFTRFWETLRKGEEDNLRNPRAFLYTITRNLVIDYYRRYRPERSTPEKEGTSGSSPRKHYKSKHVPLEEVVVEDREMRADQRALLNSQIEEVKNALSQINEDYQNIVIWYYLDELTISEIADLLQKPESSVRVLIHRAVTALKKELNNKKKGK